jgi:hypothetical protein
VTCGICIAGAAVGGGSTAPLLSVGELCNGTELDAPAALATGVAPELAGPERVVGLGRSAEQLTHNANKIALRVDGPIVFAT